MKAELIAVGTEILLGDIVNTDAQVISQGLSELGIDVYYQTVVGDNPQRLERVIREAKERADIIITTGGPRAHPGRPDQGDPGPGVRQADGPQHRGTGPHPRLL